MREIKFRIWDVNNKEMLELEELNYEFGEPAIRTTMYNDYFGPSDMILMQYTSLHDKNGKEIYEGDIVLYDDWEMSSENGNGDCFTNKGVIEYNESNCCFNVTERIMVDREDVLYEDNETLEVIGNIYENKELLNT